MKWKFKIIYEFFYKYILCLLWRTQIVQKPYVNLEKITMNTVKKTKKQKQNYNNLE